MPDKFFVGLDVTGFENNGKRKPISRVTLLADDESAYTAGDDTGLEISANCAHATQIMVDNILAQIKGYQYQAYSASDANINPAAELGDGVTVGGVYSVIAHIADDGSGYPSLSAPGEEELEDEYPAAGLAMQEFARKLAQTRALITKTAEQIRLEVASEIEGTQNAVSSLEVTVDSITNRVQDAEENMSELELTVQGITARVEDVEGNYASLEAYVDSLTLSVSNSAMSSAITLKAGDITLASEQITLSGLVTYAEDGSPTYICMGSDGLYLYHTDTAAPKATLYTTAAGDLIRLILGAGSSAASETLGRLFVEKTDSTGSIYYVSATSGQQVGFTFDNDEKISVMGKTIDFTGIDVVGLYATPVFG